MSATAEAPENNPPLHEDRLDYTPTARSVTLARRRSARLVTAWGHPHRAGEVALIVSELATNALIHGSLRGRLFRVHLTVTGGAIRIEVSDPRGERLPGLREAGRDECYGRGLVIVDAVADRWGVEPRTVGKTVFAELALQAGPHRIAASRQASGPTTTTRRPRV
ncbi:MULTISPECIES: ATP-binding protein [unclassified Streptomyces]|uniref:ATP-binding protein n=1 Tax=unclassified Streptomyces TaxID=2593676 RepID=UPI002E287365|nr:ATP-binding protein [Streptomyces sp. NBC_01423]WSX91982.1 ATP-binding protein [Streptomyces sp. NBC_00891]WSY06459.1 ATP-binding protein [Streptomyces sp. NBC_00890]WSZ08083.1 ATP-binding protein [Streptomyces sp. NBC_00869]WSZ24417.1 ATP-binding protein [Streptomyces sp. NBC_00870]